jgi:hypothetical protein
MVGGQKGVNFLGGERVGIFGKFLKKGGTNVLAKEREEMV